MFKIDFFGNKAFLRQDPQLHRQLAIAGGLDKIYDLGPSWRAEQSHTPRHLCEHHTCAVEIGFISDELDTERAEEALVSYALGKIAENSQPEIEILGVKVEKPATPFPEIRFPEVYGILKEYGKEVPFGEEPDREGEAILARHVKEKTNSDFFFMNRFTFNVKPFYVMRNHEDPRCARSVYLIYRSM